MADTHQSQPGLPLLSIWRHPRLVMRGLIAKKSYIPAYIFASASGIVNAFDFVQQSDLDSRIDPSMLLTATIGGGIAAGLVFLFLLSLLFMFFGRWLGGKGGFNELSIAVGWAMLPFLGTLLTSIAEMIMYGDAFLAGGEALVQAQAANPLGLWIILLLNFVFSVYAIILLVAGLTEAHRITVSQGAGTLFIFAVLYLVFWIAIQAIFVGL